jgi:DMSO/TMAO reductase YedYZ molybdopterin-dependent catalytic subunit/thiosulfate reductase cytochrome b subunit
MPVAVTAGGKGTMKRTDMLMGRLRYEKRKNDYGYPAWVRVAHWASFFFLTLVARSGLAILAAHPKLYWNDDSEPGDAWARFTRRNMPRDRLFASSDEEEGWPSWLALPGGHSLGLGRYWHFLGAIGWTATGVFYIARMLVTGQRFRLVPHGKRFVEDVLDATKQYLHLRKPSPGLPGINPYHPFNALQELTYCAVIFLLSPLAILTGLAQSPALLSRLPRPLQRFEDKQFSRSVHFLTLVGFGGFLVVHLGVVIWHGFSREMNKIVLGEEHSRSRRGAAIGMGIVAGTAAFHVLANLASSKRPRATRNAISRVVDPLVRGALQPLRTRNERPEGQISPHLRVNGYPPIAAYPQARGGDDTYERLLADQFRDYRLEVKGLVREPLRLSLEDLRSMRRQEQTTLHVCIQGWTGVGKWAGTPIREILSRCGPMPDARYVAFHSFGMHEQTGKPYYECVRLEDALDEQSLLAYELNGGPLPVEHGAPLRVRLERHLGFKMVKYLKAIELLRDIREVGEGMGGVREDQQHYDRDAYI